MTSAAHVRRQGLGNQELLKLRESWAHLVGCIVRRAGSDASGVLLASFVDPFPLL
jgi:hypothetical protein